MKALAGTIAVVGTLILFAGTIALLFAARPTAEMKCECFLVWYKPPTKTKFDHDPDLRKTYLRCYQQNWEFQVLLVSQKELEAWTKKGGRDYVVGLSKRSMYFRGKEWEAMSSGNSDGEDAGYRYIEALIKHGRHNPTLARDFGLLIDSICRGRAKTGYCWPYHADCPKQPKTSSP